MRIDHKSRGCGSWFILAASISISILCGGCGSLPSSGPSTARILSEGKPSSKADFQLVPLTQEVLDTLRSCETAASTSGLASLAGPNFSKRESDLLGSRNMAQLKRTSSQKITFGDVVNVTIFMSGGGLFTLDPSGVIGNSQTPLPPQVVDESGQITVPHVGRVTAAGRSLHEVEKAITEGLQSKAVNPWVIVTISERQGGNLVTIAGDVKAPRMVEIPLSGLRLLDAVAATGGPVAREFESLISVNRGQVSKTDLLGNITAQSQSNILLQPGDTVTVRARHWTYTTFGAIGQSVQTFDAEEISLTEALAKGGGVLDRRANPEAIFVYRFESSRVLDQLGITGKGDGPVIYQLNLREPKGFFMASQFHVRNKDVLYVANAGTVGLVKFLDIVNALTATPRTGVSGAANAVQLFP